jgi:CO/xanthine dehydrogenase Mo-binding subunit
MTESAPTITLASAPLRVISPIASCAATHFNPATAKHEKLEKLETKEISKIEQPRRASSTPAPIRLPLPMAGSRHTRTTAASLAVTTDNDMHDPVFPNGCAVCEVEVDPPEPSVALRDSAALLLEHARLNAATQVRS